jgi:hypothetical protein
MLPMRSSPVVCALGFAVLFSGAIVSLRAGQAPQGAQAPAPAQATQLGEAAKDTVKGAELLAEARKALGGEDRIKALQRLELKGTVRRGAPQQNINLEGDLEILIELPNKFRRNESLSIGGGGQAVDLVQAMNGTDVWEETKFAANLGGGGDGDGGGDRGGGGFRGFPGGGRQGQGGQQGDGRGVPAGVDPAQIEERLRQAQLRTRQTEFARVLLALLATSDTPVAWIGTAKAPEGTADVLEMTTVDNTQTRIFIESNTHMPLMMTWVGFAQDPIAQLVGQRGGGRGRGGRGGNFQGGQQGAQQGRQGQQGQQGQGQQQGGNAAAGADGRGRGRGNEPATLQMYLAEYKTVNGIKLPHLVTRGANGEITEEWIVKNYRINPNFRANTFTQ